MSALTFLATALTAMLAVSAILALVFHDPESSFSQEIFEFFWLIVHVVVLVALAIVYTAALLWGIGVI